MAKKLLKQHWEQLYSSLSSTLLLGGRHFETDG